MPNVICVIAGLVVLSFIIGCGREAPKSRPDLSRLPQKVEIPPLGKVEYVTPKALLDLVNGGAQLDIYFLYDVTAENPEYVVPIPGMRSLQLGEMMNIASTLPKEKPLYLVCMYGDDSRKMAQEMAKDGFDCYYLDGGSYRLWGEMRRNNWKFAQD